MVHTLIVDSQEYVYKTLGYLLAQEGFVVQTQSDGAEACRWLQSCAERHIVLLIDNGFPTQTAYHIFSTIQQHASLQRHTFILLSATDADVVNPALEIAHDSGVIIVNKPFDFAAIVALIRREAADISDAP